ncbi:MAG: inositol monophosphatase [Bryobacterales bacterium]|nr:inositol monophosphatase [Bryobacterales bacterium]
MRQAGYQAELELAVEAARTAGALLLDEFYRPGGPRGHGAHAEADRPAEERIARLLRDAFPEYGYLGEELGRLAEARDPGKHTWLIDPNDGTHSYLRGWRGPAVSVALVRAGEPVLGVVYAYAAPDDRGDLIGWAEGCGPVKRNGVAVRRAWPVEAGSDCVVLVASGADRRAAANAAALYPMRYRVMPSIAYRLALAAAGEGDVAISLHNPRDWDYAAGHALLRGAGAELYRRSGGPVTYGPDGVSGCGGRCYGGAWPLVDRLVDIDWERLIEQPETSPGLARPVAGQAVRDAELLQRAQGCLLGQLGPGQPDAGAELAILLARALLESGGYTAEAAARAYAGRSGSPLARACVLGIAGSGRPFDTVEAWAATDAALTGADAAACDAAGVAASALAFAIRWGASPAGVLQHAEGRAAVRGVHAQVRRALAARGEFENTVLAELSEGFDALRHAATFTGGGTFAGALLGATFGRDAIPRAQREQVLTCRPIAGLAGVTEPRPPACWPVDALIVAERLLTLER